MDRLEGVISLDSGGRRQESYFIQSFFYLVWLLGLEKSVRYFLELRTVQEGFFFVVGGRRSRYWSLRVEGLRGLGYLRGQTSDLYYILELSYFLEIIGFIVFIGSKLGKGRGSLKSFQVVFYKFIFFQIISRWFQKFFFRRYVFYCFLFVGG